MDDEFFGTGACGINCLTCGLGASGRCGPCGAGTSRQASKKLASQLQLLGGFCPILKCAQDRKVSFCLRDCNAFPCEHFSSGPYPYSHGFLNMQERRRKGGPPSPTG